jgi:hypothetical protein
MQLKYFNCFIVCKIPYNGNLVKQPYTKNLTEIAIIGL